MTMERSPLIDVIVPVYNGAAYIRAFFAMLAPQADEAVRFLFVDDGSTDGSGAMLDECAAEGALPVKILHQENAGVSAARNAGIAASDAAYITFFDVDDLAAPDYCAVLKAAAEQERPDLFLFRQARITDPAQGLPVSAGPEAVLRPSEAVLREFLADPTRLGVYDVLLRRAWAESMSLRFAEGFAYYEDYDFLYRAFARAERILCTERVLYGYVLRGGSAMARFSAERTRCLSLLAALEPWLSDNAPGFAEDYARWGVARTYWSVLWQAALASPSWTEFRRFAAATHADVYLRKLRDFPERRVRLVSRLFGMSPRAYHAAVRFLGRRRSRVTEVPADTLSAAAEACPDPRRVLVYGMTDNPGGIESFVMGLFRRQPAGTFDFLCDFPEIAYAGEIAAKRANVYHIPAKSRDLPGHIRGTARVLRAHPEFTTVYFNVLDAGCVFPAAVAWLHGRRVVVHSHNSATDKVRLHRLCRGPLGFITAGRAACSDLAAEYMFGRRAGEALFVPNLIDAGRFAFDSAVRAEKRAELRLGDRLTVCHVGRISAQKNPLFLVDILAELRKTAPDAVLLHVGDGEMAEEFDACIRGRGMEDAVRRLGVRPDIPAILQAADVFLLPSLYEGLPIALLEAQAAGLPSVVSDVITPQAAVTALVQRLPLNDPPEAWAGAVLESAEAARRNTVRELTEAGFDISCCAEHDRRLMRLLWGD